MSELAPRTLDVHQHRDEAVKPAELIDMSGAERLSLADRRVWNELVRVGFGPDMLVPFKRFPALFSHLRSISGHRTRGDVIDSLRKLMDTRCSVRCGDKVREFDLLAEMEYRCAEHPEMADDLLNFGFAPSLADLLTGSIAYAKLHVGALAQFRTKYGLNLYESIALRANLTHQWTDTWSKDEIRERLGVEPGKLKAAKDLRARAIEPAAAEVNQIAPFRVHINPVGTARRIVGYHIAWEPKRKGELNATALALSKAAMEKAAQLSAARKLPQLPV